MATVGIGFIGLHFKKNGSTLGAPSSAKVALKPVESAKRFAGFSERAGLRIRQSDHTTCASLALWTRRTNKFDRRRNFPLYTKVTIVKQRREG